MADCLKTAISSEHNIAGHTCLTDFSLTTLLHSSPRIIIIIKNAKIKVTLPHQGRCRGTLQNLCKTCVERCNVRLSAVRGTQQLLPISQRMTVGTDCLSPKLQQWVGGCCRLWHTVPSSSCRHQKRPVAEGRTYVFKLDDMANGLPLPLKRDNRTVKAQYWHLNKSQQNYCLTLTI